MSIYGIDVSSYQAEHFPTTVGGHSVSFAIIKATEGTSYVNPRQNGQAAWARSHGMHVGFYHFVRGGDMKKQAAYFAQKCASVEGDSLWLDWEVTDVSGAQKDAFLKELKRIRPTHKVGLYCSQNYWTTRDKTSYAADALWIAQYNGHPGKPSIQAKWTIHQYTSTPVDTNIADFSSKAAMISWAKGGKTTTPPKNTPKPPTNNSEDLDMNSADVYKAVWGQDKLAAPTSSSTAKLNKTWQPGNMLRETYDRIAELRTMVEALTAKVDALSEKS